MKYVHLNQSPLDHSNLRRDAGGRIGQNTTIQTARYPTGYAFRRLAEAAADARAIQRNAEEFITCWKPKGLDCFGRKL